MTAKEVTLVCDSLIEHEVFVDITPKREKMPSLFHLRWMLDEIKANAETWSEGKIGRWLGFVQGVMCCKSWTTIDEERKRNTMYEERGYN